MEAVKHISEAVEATARPTFFCQLARVLWTESTRSLVPKVADSNCGAENVPVFKI